LFPARSIVLRALPENVSCPVNGVNGCKTALARPPSSPAWLWHFPVARHRRSGPVARWRAGRMLGPNGRGREGGAWGHSRVKRRTGHRRLGFRPPSARVETRLERGASPAERGQRHSEKWPSGRFWTRFEQDVRCKGRLQRRGRRIAANACALGRRDDFF